MSTHNMRMRIGIIDSFLRDQNKRDGMSSVPEELLGTWTGQKITEEPPDYGRRFTLFSDGHYEYDIISSEEGGPVGAPSYGIQSHQQVVIGTVVINGSFMILRPTSNTIDGLVMQTDNSIEAKYEWQIFTTQEKGIIGLSLVGDNRSQFFYRNYNNNDAALTSLNRQTTASMDSDQPSLKKL